MGIVNYIFMGYGLWQVLQGAAAAVLDRVEYKWQKFSPFKDIKLFEERIILRVAFTNRNSFDIPVSSFEGRVTHNGTYIGQFQSSNAKMLPANQTVLWEVPVKYTTENALFALQAIMENTGANRLPFVVAMTIGATVKGKTAKFKFTDQIPLF